VIERFTIAGDRTEVFVDPNNQTFIGCGLGERLESEQCVVEHLPATNGDVDVDAPACTSKQRNNVGFHNVGPEWKKGCSAAVYHEYELLAKESVHEAS
jgi:hypothetical protein